MTFGSFCSKINQSSFQTLQPESIIIKGNQIGFFVNLEIIQSVQNTTPKDLNEVIYLFPTDNRLCIYSLTFFIGDEKIEARINETKQATEIFNEAKNAGRTTIMSEDISPGIMSIKIGNLPKKQIIKVILNCSLMAQLATPTTILTKIPLHGCDPKGNYLDLADLPSLSINADLDINQFSQIRQVTVNCDEYSFDPKKNKLSIQSSVITNDNLLIEIELTEKVQNQMVKCEKVTALTVIPEFESQSKSNYNKEFIFLVDCSASMIGDSITKAKESINYFISHVPQNSEFNIIQFGTKYKKLFEKPVKANPQNMIYAKNEVSKIKANLGGTQMLELFEELFQSGQSIQREIFIITDGEVYKREEVVKLIEENSDFNRIFAIGLGNGADAGFLDEIAEITNGKSDFVYDSKELPRKVMEQLEISLIDAAVDTEIHLSGKSEVQIVPYPIPPLLPGVVRHFFICESSETKDNGNVLITSKIPNQSDEIEIVVNNEFLKEISIEKGQRNPILSLFAKKQLKRIQDEDEEKSIKLSLESGVLCKYTSYIGVSSNNYIESDNSDVNNDHFEFGCEEFCSSITDERLDKIERIHRNLLEAERLSLERSLSRGESICSLCENPGFFMREAPKKPSFWQSISNFASKMCFWNKHKEVTTTISSPSISPSSHSVPCCTDNSNDAICDEKFVIEDTTFDSKHSWKNDACLTDIVKMQSRDGFWDISTKFIEKHFVNDKVKKSRIPDIGINFCNAMIEKRVRSTVFVLAFLFKYLNENEKVLMNSHQKALKWLNKINNFTNWEEIISNFKENIQKKDILFD